MSLFYVPLLLLTMRTLTTTEYKELQKEYYNEVLEYDSISVYYNSDYYEVK